MKRSKAVLLLLTGSVMMTGCGKSPEQADLEKWGDSTDPGSVEGGSQNSTSPRSGSSSGRFYSNRGGASGNSGTSEGHAGASSGGVSRGGFGGHGGGGGGE